MRGTPNKVERRCASCLLVQITSPKKKFSAFLLLTVPPFGMSGSGQRSKPAEVEKMVTATKETVRR